MHRVPFLRRMTAGWLLGLVLASLVPTHGHADHDGHDAPASETVGAAHHSHGAMLVDQDERVRTGGPELALPAVRPELWFDAAAQPKPPVADVFERPRGHGPPRATSPRAPPLSA